MQKVCEVCGESFEAKRSSAKVCSAKCRMRNARVSFAKKKCPCGKDIEGNNNVKYCNGCREALKINDLYRSNENRYDYLDVVSIGDD